MGPASATAMSAGFRRLRSARSGQEPTHRVSALRTLVFPGPSIKTAAGRIVAAWQQVGDRAFRTRFAVTAAGGYVPRQASDARRASRKRILSRSRSDLSARLICGAARPTLGIDCSGLVQIALSAAGLTARATATCRNACWGGRLVPADDFSNLRRGDLMFWTGHVAIACDAARIVHANAFHMAVTVEPIAEALRRIAAAGVALKSIRRMDGLDLR